MGSGDIVVSITKGGGYEDAHFALIAPALAPNQLRAGFVCCEFRRLATLNLIAIPHEVIRVVGAEEICMAR